MKTQYLLPFFLTSIALLSTGCSQKGADGRYHSAYSYDYYNQHYIQHNVQRPMKVVRYIQPVPRNVSQIQQVVMPMREGITQKTPYQQVQFRQNFQQLAMPVGQHIPPTIPPQDQVVQEPKKLKVPSNFFEEISLGTSVKNPNLQVPQRISSQKDEIISLALNQLGKEYELAGNGPSEFDCSGFTKYIFAQKGINLPRRAIEQSNVGQIVASNDLQKGDLLFFDSKNSSDVGHVGIYLGDGNFIHASSSLDKVSITPLFGGYYEKHLKIARRVDTPNYRWAMR